MKIGIIALGLIGGSILKKLSESDNELLAVTRNDKTLKLAKKYANKVSSNINILKEAEIVFVCAPIGKTIETLDKLEKIVSKNTIVCDVASVKDFVMKRKRPYKFIGSHPMAGTENSGFLASDEKLFEGAKWVLTPRRDTLPADIKKVVKLIKFMKAEPIIADSKEHDRAVAMISHLPMLLSQALFKFAGKSELALKLASSGFRDTTRLAMSNPEMADDMLNYNGKNIEQALISYEKEIEKLKGKNYRQKLPDIITKRQKMYSKSGKNIYK